jgi:hypothetical protein
MKYTAPYQSTYPPFNSACKINALLILFLLGDSGLVFNLAIPAIHFSNIHRMHFLGIVFPYLIVWLLTGHYGIVVSYAVKS